MILSVVLPVLNEATVLPATLARLTGVRPPPEILVVDGGSTDGTWAVLERTPGIHALRGPRGRAAQMNAGARTATGEWLLFLHADTWLEAANFAAARAVMARGTTAWGWFDVRLDDPRPGYRLHAWAITTRARLRQAPTGDQAIFLRRELFQAVGGFPELPLMEDVALVRRLRAHGPGTAVAPPVTTSARRWQHQGLVRTILRMWALKVQFLAGRDPEALATLYPHVR